MQSINGRKLYLSTEAVLELVYEISDKWKDEDDPIEAMKTDLRTMIRFLKEEKFRLLLEEFGIGY